MCTLTISLLMLFIQHHYQSLFNSDIDNILLVLEVMHSYGHLKMMVLIPPLVVKAQEVDNFNCTFSGCAGDDIVCYCSVRNDPLFWWDGNSSFCSITFLSNSMKIDNHDLVAEVVATSSSGGFTSKLTRRNISTGLNGTEMGCSQSQIDLVTCRPSRTDQNSKITLNVHSCQGKAWS